jgi:predicted lipoprotein with Yx(FWY)xxD motif
MKTLMMTLTVLALTATAAFALEREEIAPLDLLKLASGEEIVVDANKLTVYTFDVDGGRDSKCYDACAKAWPPVLVDANTQVREPLSTSIRKDGSIQLVLNGQPLYLFVGDSQPGDINGDGLQGVWHIIKN